MGRCIVVGGKPDMAAPVTGILLSDIAEGNIVKLNENGSPVEFYVAKHNYESALNGTGRTLFIRKTPYDSMPWDTSGVNAYATSSIDSFLNGSYKELFDSKVKSAIGETIFYSIPGNGTISISTLKRGVFMLSRAELLGGNDGTKLSIAETIGPTYVGAWFRTPYTDNTVSALVCTSYVVGGQRGSGGGPCYESHNIIPCFTLPSTAFFDEDTLLFKGVA